MPELDLSAVPAGLVPLADAMNRQPGRAMEMIARERQVRELLLLSLRQLKHIYSWNPKRTVWMGLLIGTTAFSLFWSFSTIMGMFRSTGTSLGGTVNELSQLGITLPSNISGSIAPLVSAADKSPSFGLGTAIFLTLIVLGGYALLKFLVVSTHWNDVRTLHESELAIQEELDALNTWMHEFAMTVTSAVPVDAVGKKG
jgi:hypothetical protein